MFDVWGWIQSGNQDQYISIWWTTNQIVKFVWRIHDTRIISNQLAPQQYFMFFKNFSFPHQLPSIHTLLTHALHKHIFLYLLLINHQLFLIGVISVFLKTQESLTKERDLKNYKSVHQAYMSVLSLVNREKITKLSRHKKHISRQWQHWQLSLV